MGASVHTLEHMGMVNSTESSEEHSTDSEIPGEKENEYSLMAVLKEFIEEKRLVLRELKEANQLSKDRQVLHEANANSLSEQVGVTKEILNRHANSMGEQVGVTTEILNRHGNLLSEQVGVTKEILKSQGEILSALQDHQKVVVDTFKASGDMFKASGDEILLKTNAMRSYVDTTTSVQEIEMTYKLASLIEGGEVIAISYQLMDSDERPLGDIDGMVVGVVEGIEAVIFLEVKSHIKTSSEARKALNQLRKIEVFWEDLVTGYPCLFSANHGNRHHYNAYMKLKVQEYGGRKVKYAIGAFFFGESARSYYQFQSSKPICLIGDWTKKFKLLSFE